MVFQNGFPSKPFLIPFRGRRCLEMKPLSPSRGSMRGTRREGFYTEDSERQVVEGFGNREFLLWGSVREPKALS
jgi:hypothetical protein